MKKQVIQQLQNTLEWVMQEWINTKQELAEVRIELEETQEALRRNRNQLESYKMFESMYISTENAREWLVKSVIKWETMSIWEFIIKKLK